MRTVVLYFHLERLQSGERHLHSALGNSPHGDTKWAPLPRMGIAQGQRHGKRSDVVGSIAQRRGET